MTKIFVYGTLQNPELVKALVGKSFKQDKCVLGGHKALSVVGEHYPGMVKSPGSIVSGYLLHSVDDVSLRRISKWEGSNYRPTQVTVCIDDKKYAALTYIWNSEVELGQEEWSNEAYRNGHMNDCVSVCIPQEFDP